MNQKPQGNGRRLPGQSAAIDVVTSSANALRTGAPWADSLASMLTSSLGAGTKYHIAPLSAEVASRVATAFVIDALFARMVQLDKKVEKVLEETFNSTADTYL